MKKITFSLLLLSALGFAQSPNEKIQSYLNSNYQKLGLSKQDVSDWVIDTEASSTSTNITNYYVKQQFQGIEIYNAITNFSVKNGEVLFVGDRFVKNIAQKINTVTPTVSVMDAFSRALVALNAPAVANTQIIETISNKEFRISNGRLTEDPIYAELVFQPTADDKLRLAWDFIFYTQDYKHYWSVRMDAVTGELLDKYDGVLSCNFGTPGHKCETHKAFDFSESALKSASMLANPTSGTYRVYHFETESPNHGSRQLITGAENATASPYGWHDTNGAAGVEYTITRGNNVLAKDDIAGDNETTIGASPDGTAATLTFDFPYGGTGVVPASYTSAATTNLFYMNNIMHDVWYQYGFDEASGNFQQKNYTGASQPGGLTGDAVFGDSQDGSATDNANFSTTIDGTRPRMQMFLFTQGPQSVLTINSPASIAGDYPIRDNGFSPGHVNIPLAPGIVSNLVLFDDGTPDNNDACTAAINAAQLSGKIAVIRRGTCPFVEKVKFAQDAGAVAAIIVNNAAGDVLMGGADGTITIPAVFMTQAQGDIIIAQMGLGTVNGTLMGSGFINADGDFDNGVIAHEYGHGISGRLTGGKANICLQNAEQAGEGWSDWFALMMLIKSGDVGATPKPIGTFVISENPTDGGIRNYPYSTDMSVNPLTFADSNDTESHNRGEFMAAVLWDLTWSYIAQYGFNPNKYSGTGGNNKVMRLVIDALKLQPCSPTFIDFRTALFNADQATTGGQNYCRIAEVFRRRGMGLNASSGSASNATDQVEDFTAFPPGPNCTLAVDQFQNEKVISVYPNPTKGQLNIAISNYVGKMSINVYDLNGRKVYNQEVNNFSAEKTINLNGLQTGMYMVKINGENLNYTQKIILN